MLAEILKEIGTENLKLNMISNRGIKVWPEGFKQTFCTDHWRCRFKAEEGVIVAKEEIIGLLQHCIDQNIDSIKTENLYKFDGRMAFSLGQGQ